MVAAHDFHDTVTFALYHLLTPIRLSKAKRAWEDSSAGERAWREEVIRRHGVLSGCQDLFLEEHALEAGAASAGEITFHYLHDQYHAYGALDDFLRPPLFSTFAGEKGEQKVRAIICEDTILWAYRAGSHEDERCMDPTVTSPTAAQAGRAQE